MALALVTYYISSDSMIQSGLSFHFIPYTVTTVQTIIHLLEINLYWFITIEL